MKTEIEVKLAVPTGDIDDVVVRVEKLFGCKKSGAFLQVTHQFFYEDWTKQDVFPRVRNELEGGATFTIKVKIKSAANFFERKEFETTIGSSEEIIGMMPYLGFPKKITWEKRRYAFTKDASSGAMEMCFFLDETPMGWFLEIEAGENEIEEAITLLELTRSKRITKSYLGLWEDYKKEHDLRGEDMLFQR
jgi:adenylate cyclase class IV